MSNEPRLRTAELDLAVAAKAADFLVEQFDGEVSYFGWTTTDFDTYLYVQPNAAGVPIYRVVMSDAKKCRTFQVTRLEDAIWLAKRLRKRQLRKIVKAN